MYRKCPECGANLDPCEQCNCTRRAEEEQPRKRRKPPEDREAPYTQDAYIQRCWQRWYES